MLNSFLPQEQLPLMAPPLAPGTGGRGGGAVAGCREAAGRPEWTEASWAAAVLRDDVRQLLDLPAGPDLVVALAGLPRGAECELPHAGEAAVGVGPPGHEPGFPCACQVVVAAAWHACAAWLAAGSAQGLVDAVGTAPVTYRNPFGVSSVDPGREELAVALRMSPGGMGTRINVARGLVGQPQLHALVGTGAISEWAARLVLDQVAGLEPEQATAVVAAVADRIRRRLELGRVAWTSAEINQCARRVRMRLYPQQEAAVRTKAFRDRQVSVHPHGNGMATLAAVLAETDAVRIHHRLSAIAAGMQGDARAGGDPDPRTRDQLRADLLVDLLLAAGATRVPDGDDRPRTGQAVTDVGGRPRAGHPSPADGPSDSNLGVGDGASGDHGTGHVTDSRPAPGESAAVRLVAIPAADRPEISVVVGLETLLGLSQDPGHVPGLGAIPADLARDLAADGRWQAWVTDAAGAVTATGTTGYVPTAAIARLVRARHPQCRFPGCRQAAVSCDLDHAVPYPTGPTTPGNLGPLCRRHHNLKTHAGWRLHVDATSLPHDDETPAGNGWTWHTPAGIHLTYGPPPHDSP